MLLCYSWSHGEPTSYWSPSSISGRMFLNCNGDMLVQKRDERHRAVSIEEEASWIWKKGCWSWTQLSTNNEQFWEGEQRIIILQNVRNDVQNLRYIEDKRNDFFSQSVTLCCRCQRIRWIQKPNGCILRRKKLMKWRDIITSCLCNP